MKNLFTPNGFSVVGVLVIGGIMAGLILGFSDYISSLQKESKSIAELLALQEFEKNVYASLFDKSICGYLLSSSSFNSADVIVNKKPAVLNLDSRPFPASMVSPATPGPTLTSRGQAISRYVNSIKVSSIRFEVLNGSVSGLVGNFNGQWVFEFDSEKAIRPSKPIRIRAVAKGDLTIPAMTKITECFIDVKHSIFKQSCPLGQAIQGYDKDGIIKCVPNNLSCGTGLIQNGVDNSGNPICIRQITVGGCPEGQAISAIAANQSPSCGTIEKKK